MLLAIMRQIVAHREYDMGVSVASISLASSYTDNYEIKTGKTMPLEEVKEIIRLPKFNTEASADWVDPDRVEIDDEVVEQLHHLVSTIASMYNPNPFHNFSHASHVVMSVIKLMSRIVAPTEGLQEAPEYSAQFSAELHDNTYGKQSLLPIRSSACLPLFLIRPLLLFQALRRTH